MGSWPATVRGICLEVNHVVTWWAFGSIVQLLRRVRLKVELITNSKCYNQSCLYNKTPIKKPRQLDLKSFQTGNTWRCLEDGILREDPKVPPREHTEAHMSFPTHVSLLGVHLFLSTVRDGKCRPSASWGLWGQPVSSMDDNLLLWIRVWSKKSPMGLSPHLMLFWGS